MSKPQPSRQKIPAHLVWLGLAVVAAVAYLFQLGGDHIPRNGDELVYAHIARLTAESGHWLPLVSSYDFMRNTKPPMLFWQAMVAGGWGEHWTLLRLRLPSVIYLWATALVVGLLTRKIVMNAQAGSPHPGPLPGGGGNNTGCDCSAGLPVFLQHLPLRPALPHQRA